VSDESDELLDPYGPYFYLNAPPGSYGADAELVQKYQQRAVFLTAVEQADQKRAERKAAVDEYLEVKRRDRDGADQ
jgi:hypothetical protein